MVNARLTGAALLALAIAGCGGGDSNGPDTGGNGNVFRAKIDGRQWQSGPGSATTTGVPVVLPGVYSLTGVEFGGDVMTIALYNIGSTGTYPLGVGPQVAGGTMTLSNTSGGWSTPLSGDAGTITITSLSAGRMAGTFSATLAPLTGGASGTPSITEGQFNLELKPQGTIGPLPENAGRKVSATINGDAFNAAAAGGSYNALSGGILVVTGNNTMRSLNLTLTGVPGPGTYAFDNDRYMSVTNVVQPLSNTWSTKSAGGSGSVTITSITDARIKGTFTGTLGPALSTTGSLTISNGAFDIGRP